MWRRIQWRKRWEGKRKCVEFECWTLILDCQGRKKNSNGRMHRNDWTRISANIFLEIGTKKGLGGDQVKFLEERGEDI